jgi:F420-dependent oxidoreductase-like protein
VRLGVALGYFSGAPSGEGSDGSAASRVGAAVAAGPAQALALARAAEDLDYAVAWASEAYGSDAPTVLAWLAAQTSRIDLGSAVMQVPARTATTTAMTAATLDALSQGRFRLGLGVSGPQVSEGWHGVRFDAPLQRTREHVDVVRLALARRPVLYEGEHLRLPLPGGPGVPLRLGFTPPRPRIPIYLAAVGPRNVELAGEVADGWLPVFFSPEHAGPSLEALARGRTRSADGGTTGLDVAPTVPLLVVEDGPAPSRAAAVAAASGPVRAHAALYLGGMGSRRQYFCLLGPPAALRDRLAAYAAAGVTTLSVAPMAPALEQRTASLRTAAEALDAAGVSS